MEDILKGKIGEVEDLDDLIRQKSSLIGDLENELHEMDERRKKEEEERRRRELEELNKKK